MEQLETQWKQFYEIWYKKIYRKSVEKSHVSVKSINNEGHFYVDLCTFVIIPRRVLHRMRNFSYKNCQKESKHTFYVQ